MWYDEINGEESKMTHKRRFVKVFKNKRRADSGIRHTAAGAID